MMLDEKAIANYQKILGELYDLAEIDSTMTAVLWLWLIEFAAFLLMD